MKMIKIYILVAMLILLFHKVTTLRTECRYNSSIVSLSNLSLISKRNRTGEWMTEFSAQNDLQRSSNDMHLDVAHRVTECEGKLTVHIKGVMKETLGENYSDKLLFHPKCGINAAIINNGLTVKKLNINEPMHSVALTNRALKINELFEVRLDKKNTKFSYSMGMGVTIYSPSTNETPKHMNSLRSGIWLMYNRNIYINGTQVLENYGEDLNALPVGARVGVMRSDLGNLHVFVNGVDQGPAASNIPSTVYGVFELQYNAIQGTIINPL